MSASAKKSPNENPAMSKVASTTSLREASRTVFESTRSPMMSDSAPSRIDLPAPVSPVSIVNPSLNVMSNWSMSA